jgi:tetratricopeptide (TPR) repeat protein
MPPSQEPTLPRSEGAEPLLGARWGRYIIEGPLGGGGMGIVLAARDPGLDRPVALKILRTLRDSMPSEQAQRLEREAQAMARIAHPNVITVFEVDRVKGQTYVAMELVKGTTLRGWLSERRRPWREIVDMFVAAGRGLAAVHAAGLVHRVFKPDNVLIGRDGRPRVGDFGLVADGVPDAASADEAPAGVDITTRGSAAGTPAYMSPEQWAGLAVDARSDQFAFCVALWDALWGRRPFAGSTPSELRAGATAGVIQEPPRTPRTPRWLLPVLRRGLAVDPAARWPDIRALLDALIGAVRAHRRRAALAIAAIAVLASAAITFAVIGVDEAELCAVPSARVAAVWSPQRRANLGGALATVDPAHGAQRFDKIAAALDRGAHGWTAMYVEACRATRLDRRQSDDLLDRRMACLDRWLDELEDTVRVTAQARTSDAVDHAVTAVTSLSPLEVCADARALQQALAPPVDAGRRAEAAALTRRAIELDVERRAGRLRDLPARAAAVVAEARVLDDPATLVAALAAQAGIDLGVGQDSEAAGVLRELTAAAARARDDRQAALAWSQLVFTLGSRLSKRDDARALVPSATAAVERAGRPPELRAELLYSQAAGTTRSSQPGDTAALLHDAFDLFSQALATTQNPRYADRLADVVVLRARAQVNASDYAAAVASCRDAIERWRAVFGPDSPGEAFGWQMLGVALESQGKRDDSLAAFREALRIWETRLGDSPKVAFSLVSVASTLDDQGHSAEALQAYDRALQIDRALLDAGDPQLAAVLFARALPLMKLGRLDESARSFDEAIAIYERAGTRSRDVVYAYLDRAELELERHQLEAALADDLRAIAMAEQVAGARSDLLIVPLTSQGRCLLEMGRPADAIGPLERAVALPADPSGALEVAGARAALGQARVETRRDVAGGLAMVRAARALLVTDPVGADAIVEIDRWLATPKVRALVQRRR